MFHRQGPTLLELVRQGLSSTDHGYDLLAPKFEYTPFRTPDAVLTAAARAAGPAGAVLDLCCGTGAAMRAFRPFATRVVGVDRSRGMLEQARESLARGGGAPFGLVRGDALALPFSRAFDTVVSFGAFGHIEERDEPRMVAEVRRVLKPGGRFVFATADRPAAWHPGRILAEGFNLAMRVRNALIKPQFIMYYLTFLLPRARALLEQEGFTVEAPEGVFAKPFARLRLVIATARR